MEQIYPYAVARVRAIENNLLTNTELEQMVEESPERILGTLQEHQYNTDLIDRVQDFEKVLKYESEKLYKLIKELVPEEDFTKLFICKNDYHNIKTILKGEITQKDYEKFLVHGGVIPVEELKDAVIEKKLDSLPEIMQKGVLEAINLYEKEQKSQIIDLVLDKSTYSYMMNLAQESKNDFIINYVEKLCDISNLRTFFRIKRASNNFKNFEMAYIKEGSISIETFAEAFDSDEPVFAFKQTSYFEIFDEAIKNHTSFDKICDNYLMDYVKVAKFEALGVEPLVAYTYAKEIEIKNIRIILTGKVNNVTSIEIKERLRDSYV